MSLGDRRGTISSAQKSSCVPSGAYGRTAILFLVLTLFAVVVIQQHALVEDPEAQSSDLLALYHSLTSQETKHETILETKPLVSPTIDILSIGSKTRIEFQDAQQATFGAAGVRSFVRATEQDDVERECHVKLTNQGAYKISNFCRRSNLHLKTAFPTWKKMTAHFASQKWLSKKTNPAGWMCAQKRPADAFYKLLHTYGPDKPFPDYLLVVDDDTYLNLPAVTEQLVRDYNPAPDKNSHNHEAFAIAGCMIRSRVNQHNFTHPYGGFGMFFNRAALENFLRPLHCNLTLHVGANQTVRNSVDSSEKLDHIHGDFDSLACWRLAKNSINEQRVFRPGMSIADLLHAYTANQAYLKFSQWQETGYCLHSDWMWGYFVNFYPIAAHTTAPAFANVPEDRLLAYRGSTIYAGRQTPEVKAEKKECNNMEQTCTEESHICHYVTPEQMKNLAKMQQPRK